MDQSRHPPERTTDAGWHPNILFQKENAPTKVKQTDMPWVGQCEVLITRSKFTFNDEPNQQALQLYVDMKEGGRMVPGMEAWTGQNESDTFFRYDRVVDLSRPLVPGQNQHPWFRYETRVESIVPDPASAPPGGEWYVVTQMQLSGHAGTHVEAPFHARRDGANVGELAVDRFFGEAVVLDLSDVPCGAPFHRDDVATSARRAGGIRAGDIAFLRFDWDRRAGEDGGRPPYPEPEALRWLVDRGIKLLGIDSPGLELPGNRALVNHRVLFDRGIPLIESLANLDELRESRVYVFAVPVPVHGTDAVPLRVSAFE